VIGRRKRHVPLILLAASVLAGTVAGTAHACKQWIDFDNYPVEYLSRYDAVLVVQIASVTPEQSPPGSWHSPPFSFTAKVIRTFRGATRPGDVIAGTTSTDEEPQARCPIYFAQGDTLLIVLNGAASPFTLPRYSAYVPSSDNPHFKTYLNDVKGYYAKRHAH
jgi:hypothetical protein